MTLVIFIIAVGCSLVLRRQEQYHILAQAKKYVQLGWVIPPAKPKVPVLESLLGIYMGLILLAVAGANLAVVMGDEEIAQMENIGNFNAVLIASGLALCTLGIRVLIARKKEGTLHLMTR
jgi:hypothetical protein